MKETTEIIQIQKENTKVIQTRVREGRQQI